MSAALFGLLLYTVNFFGNTEIPVTKTDSLNVQLDTIVNVEQRVDVLKLLVDEEIETDPETALPYLEELLEIGKENNDIILIADTHNQIGYLWFKVSKLQQSTEHYFKALDYLEDKPDHYALLCRINNNIAWNFQQQHDYQRALEYYNIGEKFCKKSDEIAMVAHLLNNKAVVYKNLRQYDTALKLIGQAMTLNKKNGDVQRELHNLNNMGVIYLEQGRYNQANKYFKQALKMNHERKDYHEATNNLMNLGRSFYQQGKYEAAEDTLKHALNLSEITRSIPQKEEILFDLYEVKREQKEFEEALSFFKQYHDLEDSLFKRGQYTDLIELEAKYKVAQKERVLQESQNQLLKQRFISTMYLVALFFAAVLIGFLIWVYSSKKRNERKLIALYMEIDQQNEKIQSINQNLEKTVNKRTKVIQEQNNQLREFAFMNSHNIRRPLSNILGLLSLLAEETEQENVKELTRLAKESAAEMDQIIKDVNQQLKEGEL
ncbi:tetratricopeptide repeat protein [Reichenbachiella ulvae]|uniref:histidine kinase n=1 Tax=Reichenbachiella ulvae TaxID=2980104 RepID=A0ABT3CN74_9BACT|nr:tetratricopeptide repeat protein [Reichenbachiella ulvae]MCV9385173.1 tetratricopeptide repeat protein [Reichenbachiella ulvae]